MIKAAFCDDDLSVLSELQVLLDEYRLKQNREIDYTVFRDPLELLAVIERGIRFDVLLLDVIVPGENGIDTAAEVRCYLILRPHRSYLVNPEYVQNLSPRAITMSSLTEIPIPRGKYNEVKNTFLEYSFHDRQVIL